MKNASIFLTITLVVITIYTACYGYPFDLRPWYLQAHILTLLFLSFASFVFMIYQVDKSIMNEKKII